MINVGEMHLVPELVKISPTVPKKKEKCTANFGLSETERIHDASLY